MGLEIVQDGVIAFLAAVGLAALFWLLSGSLCRRRLPGAALLLPLRQDEGLREAVAAAAALRQWTGLLPLLLADCGLSENGWRQAAELARRYEGAALLRPEELPEHLK